MKKCKNVLINGIVFELKGANTFVPYDNEYDGIYNGLDDFYKSCSIYKRNAWKDICTWCRQIPQCGISITSANTNFFTVRGWCKWNGVPYFIEFTGRHNRATVCNGMKCIKVLCEEHYNTCTLYPAEYKELVESEGWVIVK